MRQKIFYFSLKSERPRTQVKHHYLHLLKRGRKSMHTYFKEKFDSLLSVDLDAKQASQILTLQRKYERKASLEKQQVEHEKKTAVLFWDGNRFIYYPLCLVLVFF